MTRFMGVPFVLFEPPFISRLGDAMMIGIAKAWHTAKFLCEGFAVLSCGVFKAEKHGTFFAEIGAFWTAYSRATSNDGCHFFS